jgi:hypothetical protein
MDNNAAVAEEGGAALDGAHVQVVVGSHEFAVLGSDLAMLARQVADLAVLGLSWVAGEVVGRAVEGHQVALGSGAVAIVNGVDVDMVHYAMLISLDIKAISW